MARISGKNVTFRQRGKDKTLYATVILPFKEQGQTVHRRIERSTRTADRKQAEKFAAAMIAEAYENLNRPEPVAPITEERLFGHALGAYEQRTGHHRFLPPDL